MWYLRGSEIYSRIVQGSYIVSVDLARKLAECLAYIGRRLFIMWWISIIEKI